MAKKRIKPQKNVEVVELPELINRTQLVLVRLDGCDVSRGGPEVEFEHNAQIQFRGFIETKNRKELTEHLLIFEFKFGISTAAKNEPVNIAATFRSIYHLSPPIDVPESEIQKFGRIVAMLNLWPYWREFVQSITVRMALPPLTLPLITPSDLGDWQEDNISERQSSTVGGID